MVFRIQCICLFGLLLAVMVLALPPNYSLHNHEHKRIKRAAVETSSCKQDIEKNGMSLFNEGIYNLTLNNMTLEGDFFGSLKSVFDIIQNDRAVAKMRIEIGLKRSFMNSYDSLNTKAKNVNDLESALVYMYTEDYIYRYLNGVLRNHSCTYKKLEQKDRDMAAYATALLATLLYWKNLPAYSGTTFRVIEPVLNIKDELQKYEDLLNSSVVFPAFSSSSKCPLLSFVDSREFILLEIDNSQNSFWSPKDIADQSKYPDENELLYPSSAEFKVMSIPQKIDRRNKIYHKIHLKLEGNGDSVTDKTSPIRGSGYLQFIPLLFALINSKGHTV
uniref:Uncharacterized protein LOC111106262 n=1 Tax=Crassostrea virginica TaxID=6565 RepID=A0A8B8AZI9_CRAVI|nr:uncharacterized protein LOC111106262 [Crassostrea virginica]